MPTFSAEVLTRFAANLLATGGLSPEEATTVARDLVAANLRGYDSHGLMRIPQYVNQVEKGEIVPGAKFEVLRETPSLLRADAHWGFGQLQARRLMQRLTEKAQAGGIGVGTIIRCAHTGRLGEYCEMATEADMIGMVMVNNHGAITRIAPGRKGTQAEHQPDRRGDSQR